MELQMMTRTRVSNMNNAGDSVVRGLNPPTRNTLSGTTRTYPTSTVLFFQNSSALEVYYIEQGLVKLICLGENGQELIVDLKTEGVFLGASSVILQKAHPVTAITITSCSLMRISKEAFLHLTKTDPQFCWLLHQQHSNEIHRQASQMTTWKYSSARKRLEKLLLQFASSMEAEKQSCINLRLPLKHWEIAQLIGVTPEHLSRILKQIQQEGILRKCGDGLIVSDLKKLRNSDD